MLDIHSHILPAVDDGAKDIDEAIAILEAMHLQGITSVVATPHFYPHEDNLEDYNQKISTAFNNLKKNTVNRTVPEIYLGCEILYYTGISKAQSIRNFTINNSNYLLIELNTFSINKMVFEELLYLRDVRGIIPIIAHIERYRKSRKYKALIEFVKQNNILCQVNATSFFSKDYTKTLKKLFVLDCVSLIATDSHSMKKRPPLLKRALEKIAEEYGTEVSERLIHNADKLYLTIVNKEHGNDF